MIGGISAYQPGPYRPAPFASTAQDGSEPALPAAVAPAAVQSFTARPLAAGGTLLAAGGTLLAAQQGERMTVIAVAQDLQGAAVVDPWFQKAGLKALQPYLDRWGDLNTTAAAAHLADLADYLGMMREPVDPAVKDEVQAWLAQR